MKTGTYVVVCLLLAAAMSLQAQVQWQSLNGPWDAERPEDIAVGYSGTAYIYTVGGTGRELLVSMNEGDDWLHRGEFAVVAVACEKVNGKVVYAAKETSMGSSYDLRKSGDGGLSWTTLFTFGRLVTRIAISPHNSNVVYVGLGGQDANQALFRTTNGGANWNPVPGFNAATQITQIVFDPENPSFIYVTGKGSGTGSGVWRSDNGGVTWFPKNQGMSNIRIKSLGITPQSGQTGILYAGNVEENGNDERIYKSTDRGENWSATSAQFGAADIIVDPARQNLVYAATKNGALRTIDAGGNWQNKSSGIYSKIGRRLAVVEGGGQLLRLLFATWAAFYRSNDDAEHWSEKTKGMALLLCTGVSVNSQRIVTATYIHSVAGAFVNRSLDAGSNWNVVFDNSFSNDPFNTGVTGNAVAISPSNPNVILASAHGYVLVNGQQVNSEQRIFRSGDAGETWNPAYYMDNAFTYYANIVFDPRDNQVVYSADYSRVLRSTDGGVSWGQLVHSPANVNAVAIDQNSGSPSLIVYAGGDGVWKSADFGSHWIELGLTGGINSLSVDPSNGLTVYAGSYTNGVYKTTNGGESWNPINNGISNYPFCKRCLVHPLRNTAVYAVVGANDLSPSHVFHSIDAGATWLEMSSGLNNLYLNDLTFDVAVGGMYPRYLHAATAAGVYRVDLAPFPPQDVQVAKAKEGGQFYPRLTWTASSESDIASYNIWRWIDIEPLPYWLITTIQHPTNSFVDHVATVGILSTAYYKITAVDLTSHESSFSNTVSIGLNYASKAVADNQGATIPKEFDVEQNYPNPFNPATEIRFDLPEDSFVSLNVFDVLGRKVANLVNGFHPAGYHTATWNGSSVSSGVYFARFSVRDESGNVKFSKINKLILAK